MLNFRRKIIEKYGEICFQSRLFEFCIWQYLKVLRQALPCRPARGPREEHDDDQGRDLPRDPPVPRSGPPTLGCK